MAYNEEARFAEKQNHFVGCAKVHLKHLTFDLNGSQPADLTIDPKNVERLIQVFKLEGCLRLDLAHHIPAVINAQFLRESLRHSQIPETSLYGRQNPPALSFPDNTYLLCLHGKHRIAAAKNILLPGDMWWTVDLYLDDLGEIIRREIREDYANSKNFCDGDIFQQIRYCQKAQDSQGEGRWMARLSEAKRKDLKQLQKRIDLRPVVDALDNLLPYVGLWPSLQIGTFHRLLSLRCPEELQNYLAYIHSCWDFLMDKNEFLRQLVDFKTVQLLQTRNPRASRRDWNKIDLWMDEKRLFPMVTDPTVRARIYYKLRQMDRMIPSIYTFLEDTKWLEPCAKIMRSIIPPGSKETTRDSIFRMYNGSNTLRVQNSSLLFTEYEGSEIRNVEYGYLQLWLFAWRHFPELSGLLPRKDKGEPKPKPKASNEQCRYQFAQLASSLGFKSHSVSALQVRNPDYYMALEFLREARPQDFFTLPEDVRLELASRICQVLPISGAKDSILGRRQDLAGEVDLATEQRCGRPFEQSHSISRSEFFLEDIYAEKTQTLSYFTVNQDIFRAFFGLVPPWKPTGDQEMEDRPQVNIVPSMEVTNDRVAGALYPTNPDNHSRALNPIVATTAREQENHTLNENTGALVPAPTAREEEDHTLNDNTGALVPAPTARQEVDLALTTANEGETSIPRNERLDANVAALPALDMQRQGQYPSHGEDSVRQVEAADDLLNGDDDVVDADQANNLQLVSQRPALSDIWEHDCRNGDFFYVYARSLESVIVRKGAQPPDRIMASITTHVLLQWNWVNTQLKYIDIKNVQPRADVTHDGIVYIFQRGRTTLARSIINARDSITRLKQLEEHAVDNLDTIT